MTSDKAGFKTKVQSSLNLSIILANPEAELSKAMHPVKFLKSPGFPHDIATTFEGTPYVISSNT